MINCKYETLIKHVGHQLICEKDKNSGDTVILCADCLEELCVDTGNTAGLHLHIGHTLKCKEYGTLFAGIECEECNMILMALDVNKDHELPKPRYVFQ